MATPPKEPHSRVLHEPTATQRTTVETMSGYGIPLEDIAAAIGINRKTLTRHYKVELKQGAVKANSQVAQSLFRQAVGAPVEYDAQNRIKRAELKPVTIAGIFWAKTRMGWKETTTTEHVGKDGKALPAPGDTRIAITVQPDDLKV